MVDAHAVPDLSEDIDTLLDAIEQFNLRSDSAVAALNRIEAAVPGFKAAVGNSCMAPNASELPAPCGRSAQGEPLFDVVDIATHLGLQAETFVSFVRAEHAAGRTQLVGRAP